VDRWNHRKKVNLQEYRSSLELIEPIVDSQ